MLSGLPRAWASSRRAPQPRMAKLHRIVALKKAGSYNFVPGIKTRFQGTVNIMNLPRIFLLVAVAYILVGLGVGAYMGASNDHTLIPLHAHLNLLGFVMPAIFALVYRAYPAMAQTRLAPLHFWLHQVGTLALLVMLFLFLSGRVGEAAMVPAAPISELLIVAGTALFGLNLLRNAR